MPERLSPQASGGIARAKALSAAERRSIAQRAAAARWNGKAPAARHVSPAKLARQIAATVAGIKTRKAELQKIAAQALDAAKDADAVIAALDQAGALLDQM